ncbi:MAG: rhomboid family intramembrane serine protease [Chitinophagaceae bacterium]|nr:rhomboid family intramembrane serine protease [Chitinophagaceae bacterium]MBK8605591.1 rhomboid family intramembrane serine protease [Chitinophagaceae bacterium]MBP8115237.1 rhomboid family intramembrane serine protease [Chitinophagaceae bacterium]HQX96335.1 rhomboid family intramembrane serine protease [Chitinophagaceae bacterium]HQZ51706.1 rhomboid family intramembrane serine protease [Chitinophagaceae bacterium]
MALDTTLIIIIITVLVSLGGFNSDKVMNDLIFYPPAISKQNQWYRFVTSGFLHSDYTHLFFNMLTLYFFGRGMESFYNLYMGKLGFLIFYIAGIIISSIPTFIKHRNDYHYRSLGASGGVSAVVFAYILFAPWDWFTFPPVPAIIYALLYIYYSIYMSKKGGDNINHDAHLWGAAFGVVFTIAMEPRIINVFLDQITHPKGPGAILFSLIS